MAPPPLPWRHMPLPDVRSAPLQPPIPCYSLHPTKDKLARGSQARPLMESINNALIHMSQIPVRKLVILKEILRA